MTDATDFHCSKYIREIGRGKEGARGLQRDQAKDLLQHIFAGDVNAHQLGAVLIALRVKGETVDELTGFLDSVSDNWPSTGARDSVLQALQDKSQSSGKPVVILPSYNGARRKPNMTPLLAGLLAQKGYPVLCHGLTTNPLGRVTTYQIFNEINWPCADQPVFCGLDSLYPQMADLLAMQATLGVRNFSHTLVKLMVPAVFQNSLLVTSYTHPEFLILQTEVLAQYGQTALVIRGHEGEAVASPYRIPRMDLVRGGQHRMLNDQEASFTEKPDPRPDISALATARTTERLLANPAELPHGLVHQLNVIDQIANNAV